MFTRKGFKQSKIKRAILKLLNVYAYEKETLNIVNPDYKNRNGNLIDFNKHSFNFANGYLELSRKIKNIDVFFRYAPKSNLWNSTERWKRIIPNINKEILISVSLISLSESLKTFNSKNKLNINLHLISDDSDIEFDNKLFNMVNSDSINIIKHKSKIKGNRGSYLECCDQAEKANDIIFFVEDDYIFENNCIDEMLTSFSRISSILKKDVILCPSDYPFYYDSLYETSLFIGKNYKWRIVGETLLTIMFSKNILDKDRNLFRSVGDSINEPFEKPLHKIYEKVNCLAPINSLSYHISRSVPAINEDWKKTWEINFKKYQDFC